MSPAGGLGGVRARHPSLMWDQTQMLGKPAVAGPGEGAGRTPLKTIPLPLRLFGSLVTFFKIVRCP